MCANTTPEVPSVQETMPSSTMPLPTALAAWSPPPPTTGVPAARPVASAACAEIMPRDIARFVAFRQERTVEPESVHHLRSDQRRFTTSNTAVPEASDTSEANSPVSL